MKELNDLFDLVKYWYLMNHSHKSKKRFDIESTQIAHYLARKYTKYKLSDIGFIIGHKKYSTVLHSIKTVRNLETIDKAFAKRLTAIDRFIYAEMFSKKVYISGSISKNIAEYGWNYTNALFLKGEKIFPNHSVINPMKLFTTQEVETFTQLQFMSRCISLLVKCEIIYMLKGYEESYNACIELEIARSLNLKIIYE